MPIGERYITDQDGNRLGVLLGIDEYQNLLDQLEELDAIRDYDAAQQSDDEAISFELAILEIESQRE
ncbi:MAG: hypothetical protein HC890_15155 [Chloroflexaceae bacterium]|nr:hypothetical protein [Chloroflexaceae bacterium]